MIFYRIKLEDKYLRIIDMKQIIKGQDVPKIAYRPVKSLEDRIYFEKVIGTIDEEWTEGIYRFDIEDAKLTRVDKGDHFHTPSLYDIEVPGSYEDVLAIKDMDYIYYCVSSQSDDAQTLSFFRINLETDIQDDILNYSFLKHEYVYKGLEILSEGYFIFTLSDAKTPFESNQYDRVYLVDVNEKKIYEIFDLLFKLTSGKREVIGHDPKYILVEEVYLSEEEEIELLLSDDVELAIDVPDDMNEEFVFKNSLRVLPFDNFIRLVKAGSPYYEYELIDSIFKEGVIRIVGETPNMLYYKKNKHEHVLKYSKDFNERRLKGKEEIFSLDKQTLKINKVMELGDKSILAFEDETVYEISEGELKINIKTSDNRGIAFEYIKDNSDLESKEYFYDLFNHRYLVMGVIKPKDKFVGSYLKVVDMFKLEEDRQCEDLFIIDDTVFIG